MTKRSQVMTVNPVINPPHRTTEISGNQGTKGTRNARGRSGCLRRRKITPRETRTKAKRDPILERTAASPISTKPAGIPTAKHAIHVDQWRDVHLRSTTEKSFSNST